MLFSLEWILDLCPAKVDAARVASELTARGLTVDSVEETSSGVVLDIDIPANRPDCLGHRGVARELAGALGGGLAEALEPPEAPGGPEAGWGRVEIVEPALCSRYTASFVRGVSFGSSPDWVAKRLDCCGLRSINNVVDASNLVLLETGHPIHFFDYSRLEGAADAGGPRVSVRRASAGERLTTLDGVERTLDTEMLVIADAGRAVALAGVIGGADSEIRESTRDVLIEAARFQPESVRATSRRLGIQTDASFRFERGVDAEGTIAAQALAIRLLRELAGGEPAAGMADVYTERYVPRRLRVRDDELARLLGFQPERRATRDALEAIGLAPEDGSGEGFEVRIPSWRPDLEREADLVEEVARHIGYDRIPTAAPGPTPSTSEDAAPSEEERSRDLLAHLGFQEAIGYAMIAAGEDDAFVASSQAQALGLTNPIAEPLSKLRRSILPGLMRAADFNLRRGNHEVRLFEVGRVFLPGEPGRQPAEPLRLGLAWAGLAQPLHWSGPPRQVDLYDVIGVVDHLLGSLHAGLETRRMAQATSAFHPGRSLSWQSEDAGLLAWGGALHPDLQAGIDHPLFLIEVDLDPLTRLPAAVAQHAAVARVPSVVRDLSLVMSSPIAYGELLEALRRVDPPAPVEFLAVDRYEGPPLGDGESSLTVRVTLRPQEQTLTDSQTEGFRASLVAELRQQFEVRIRS